MGEICVVVDNHRLEPLLDNSDGASGSLRITTIRSGQTRALIEIKSRHGERTTLMYSLEVNDLPGDRPKMEVRGRIDSRALKLEFLLQDKVFHRATVELPRPRRTGWWVFVPAFLIVAAMLVLLLPRKGETPGESVSELSAPVTMTRPPSEATPEPPKEPRLQPAPAVNLAGEPADIAEQPVLRTVYFLPDRATLTAETRKRLDELLISLQDDKEWQIKITGHCAIAGTEKGRLDLSLKRAREVFAYLEAGGFSPETEPAVTGAGDDEPVTRDLDLQHLNRRVEITATIADSG